MITCGACHLGYFLFAALAASFLGIPSFSRVTLLLIVTMNAIMETQSGHSLDFISISVFMLITCTGEFYSLENNKEAILPGSVTVTEYSLI